MTSCAVSFSHQPCWLGGRILVYNMDGSEVEQAQASSLTTPFGLNHDQINNNDDQSIKGLPYERGSSNSNVNPPPSQDHTPTLIPLHNNAGHGYETHLNFISEHTVRPLCVIVLDIADLADAKFVWEPYHQQYRVQQDNDCA